MMPVVMRHLINYTCYMSMCCVCLYVSVCDNSIPLRKSNVNPGPVGRSLSICHINIQSLSDIKLVDISDQIAKTCDVVTLSETFLDASSQLNLDFLWFSANL